MELRFLEGNFEHGKFKLQYREGVTHDCPWLDVPCVKADPKPNWCEHITWEKHYRRTMNGEMGWYVNAGWGLGATEDTMFCPICGARRP